MVGDTRGLAALGGSLMGAGSALAGGLGATSGSWYDCQYMQTVFGQQSQAMADRNGYPAKILPQTYREELQAETDEWLSL